MANINQPAVSASEIKSTAQCPRCGLTSVDWAKHKHLPMAEANPLQYLHWNKERLMPYKQQVDLALTERQYDKAIDLAKSTQGIHFYS